jgi:hypothetical protein
VHAKIFDTGVGNHSEIPAALRDTFRIEHGKQEQANLPVAADKVSEFRNSCSLVAFQQMFEQHPAAPVYDFAMDIITLDRVKNTARSEEPEDLM